MLTGVASSFILSDVRACTLRSCVVSVPAVAQSCPHSQGLPPAAALVRDLHHGHHSSVSLIVLQQVLSGGLACQNSVGMNENENSSDLNSKINPHAGVFQFWWVFFCFFFQVFFFLSGVERMSQGFLFPWKEKLV